MRRLFAFLAYLWRSLKWAVHSLWLGYPAPRVERELYSRSYMRKVWADSLRSLDRRVNHLTVRGQPVNFLLMERRVMVARRRHYLFPEEAIA